MSYVLQSTTRSIGRILYKNSTKMAVYSEYNFRNTFVSHSNFHTMSRCRMAEKSTANSTVAPSLSMRMSISMISKKFSKVTSVNTSTLNDWITQQKKDLVVLDCRPEEEFAVSHIPGAVRVDYKDDVKNILQKISTEELPEDKTVVCYCSVGYRSSLVVDKVQDYYDSDEIGRQVEPKIYNLEGSLFKWANEGRPMINGLNEKTKYAHPYSAIYGKLLNSELRKNKL